MPPAVVTETFTSPALFAGVTAVICVSEFTVKVMAETPPKATAEVPVKPVPVRVTDVPPANGPMLGETEVMVGAGT